MAQLQKGNPNKKQGGKPNSGIAEQSAYWLRKLWNNYVVRNLIVAAGALLVLVFIASLVLKVVTRHSRYKQVPEFIGLSITEAEKLAHKKGLHIEIIDSLFIPVYEPGVVLEQTPGKGTDVKSGRNIFVSINSFTQKSVQIPYVKGYSLRQAKNILETNGLEIEKIVYVSDMATNYVLEQTFNGKPIRKDSQVKAEIGSGVVLTVGRASSAPAVSMPRLVGLSLKDAKSRLWENGLNVGKITFDEGIDLMSQRNAKVYEQGVAQGRNTTLGTTVSLKLTLDAGKTNEGVKTSEKTSRQIEAEQAVADSIANAEAALQQLVDEETDDNMLDIHQNDADSFFE